QVRPPSAVRASARGAVVGLAKSPPMARPCVRFRNATPNTPAGAPRRSGVWETFQGTPPSVERYTRDPCVPPLPNHALWLPEVVMHSLLAANPYSLGEFAFGTLAA